MLRIFSTYLQITDKSGWEQNWQEYRKNNTVKFFHLEYSKYWGYTKAQSVVFLALGILAFIFPNSIIFFSKPLTFHASTEFWVHTILSVLFIFSVFLTGILGVLDPEKKAKERWEIIKNKSQ